MGMESVRGRARESIRWTALLCTVPLALIGVGVLHVAARLAEIPGVEGMGRDSQMSSLREPAGDHHSPVFGIDFQGSRGGSASPLWRSSTDT